MFSTQTSFIGIDPTAGQKPFVYAAMDADLRLLALGHCGMEEILAFAAGQHRAVVAISAPRQPNQGVLAKPEVREKLSPPPRPGRWVDFRLAEYELRQHNITIPQTPAAAESCPNWMQVGFKLYQRLCEFGYQTFPTPEADRQVLEVYPFACYTALMGVLPFPKHTLEGRLQRQVLLHELKLRVPDALMIFEEITRYKLLNGILPLDDLYSPEELDALIAAYTARKCLIEPDQVTAAGAADEGQIFLPVPELKPHY